MQIDEQEFYDFLRGLYQDECQADEIKKGVAEDLKSWAEEHEINVKVIKGAYSYFKKAASGRIKPDENDAVNELSTIIDKFMGVDSI